MSPEFGCNLMLKDASFMPAHQTVTEGFDRRCAVHFYTLKTLSQIKIKSYHRFVCICRIWEISEIVLELKMVLSNSNSLLELFWVFQTFSRFDKVFTLYGKTVPGSKKEMTQESSTLPFRLMNGPKTLVTTAQIQFMQIYNLIAHYNSTYLFKGALFKLHSLT